VQHLVNHELDHVTEQQQQQQQQQQPAVAHALSVGAKGRAQQRQGQQRRWLQQRL
jgi:hypothetical protein